MMPRAYTDVLARDIRAARSRLGLSQADAVERMQALGFTTWHKPTLGNVERGQRRVTAEEIIGLAYALETSVRALLRPTDDDKLVALPGGAVVAGVSVQQLVDGTNDYAVQWDGNRPVIPPAAARFDGPQGTTFMPRGGTPWQQPVVAAIVTSPLGVLVGKRTDGKPPWTFIAGEVEPGELPEDAAIREVKEETGLRVTAGQLIGERRHPKTGRQMIYIAATPTHGTDVFVGDEVELAEVRWVSLAEADQLLPGMYEPVREHLVQELGES